MAKSVKKVDVKKVAKSDVSKKVADFFKGIGVTVNDGQDYGFTEGTLVLSMDKCDVQVKLITPKAGVDRYEKLVDEDEEVEETGEGEEGNGVEEEHDPNDVIGSGEDVEA